MLRDRGQSGHYRDDELVGQQRVARMEASHAHVTEDLLELIVGMDLATDLGMCALGAVRHAARR